MIFISYGWGFYLNFLLFKIYLLYVLLNISQNYNHVISIFYLKWWINNSNTNKIQTYMILLLKLTTLVNLMVNCV